jgi:hypothetical protein
VSESEEGKKKKGAKENKEKEANNKTAKKGKANHKKEANKEATPLPKRHKEEHKVDSEEDSGAEWTAMKQHQMSRLLSLNSFHLMYSGKRRGDYSLRRHHHHPHHPHPHHPHPLRRHRPHRNPMTHSDSKVP